MTTQQLLNQIEDEEETTAQKVLNQVQTECEYGISCSDRIGCLHCQRRAFVLIRGSTKFQAICRGWIERNKKEEAKVSKDKTCEICREKDDNMDNCSMCYKEFCYDCMDRHPALLTDTCLRKGLRCCITCLTEEEVEEEEEREYEYSYYGKDEDTGEIMVAGGGMGNGNAYATIKIVDDCTVLYREYGKNAWSEVYRNSELEWCDEGYNFDVVPC